MAYLMEWQVKAAIIVALMVIVFAWFLSKDAMFTRNRLWLLSALVAPWILPLVAMPSFIRSIIYAERTAVEVPHLSIPFSTEATIEAQTSTVWNWSHLLGGIYLLISLVFVVRLVWGYMHLLKLKRNVPKTSFKGLDVYLLSDDDVNPFSFFQSVFVPNSVMTKTNRDHILNHERAHCLQWHSVDIILAECMLLFQWWNPFAWWLRKLIAQNHEFCVDKTMMQISDEPKQYQYSLINYLPGSKSLKLVNNFSQSLIKKRIIMMNNTIQNKLTTHLKGVFVTALTVLALLACTDSEKLNSDEKVETLAGSRSVIEYDDGTSYSVVLTDNGFVEENSNTRGAKYILDGEVVDWSTIKGLKPEQIKAFGSIPAGNNHKGLLPEDNNGAISIYTVDYEFPKSETPTTLPKAIYLNGESYEGDMNSVPVNTIASINILKGDAAIEKYGEGYEDGVIEITTKTDMDDESTFELKVEGVGSAKPAI